MIKTHTFRLGTYNIEFEGKIYGLTAYPDKIKDDKPINYKWEDTGKYIIIAETGGLSELDTTIHEAMHAEGIPFKYIHDKSPDRIARFLWRLGYRKKKEV